MFGLAQKMQQLKAQLDAIKAEAMAWKCKYLSVKLELNKRPEMVIFEWDKPLDMFDTAMLEHIQPNRAYSIRVIHKGLEYTFRSVHPVDHPKFAVELEEVTSNDGTSQLIPIRATEKHDGTDS